MSAPASQSWGPERCLKGFETPWGWWRGPDREEASSSTGSWLGGLRGNLPLRRRVRGLRSLLESLRGPGREEKVVRITAWPELEVELRRQSGVAELGLQTATIWEKNHPANQGWHKILNRACAAMINARMGMHGTVRSPPISAALAPPFIDGLHAKSCIKRKSINLILAGYRILTVNVQTPLAPPLYLPSQEQ